MKIDDNPKWYRDLPADVANRIALNDKRTIEGSEEVYISPAYESVSDDDLIAFVRRLMSRGNLTDTLLEIEESNISKIGPRSISRKWVERRDSLTEYYSNKTYIPARFGGGIFKPRLLPAEESAVVANLLRRSSTGLPFLVRKGTVIDNGSYKDAESGKYPCMLYTRTQEAGKDRIVWGYPIADTLEEQAFAIPFLGVEKGLPQRAALLGPDHVDRAITDLMLVKRKDEVLHIVDFSAYDASLHPELVHQAFSHIASAFQSRYIESIYDIFKTFISIPILTPEGVWSGLHGVPSGSSFTNTVDSLVQLEVSGYLGKNCQVQGDDGVYVVHKNDVEMLNARFTDAGLKLNAEKSFTFPSHEAVFLQRYYHPNYVSPKGGLGGVYPIARALNRIKYLERWTDFDKAEITGDDYFSLRTIAILENCKHHPHFEDLVKFAHKQDKVNLAFTSDGLQSFSRIIESKARAGVFNQYGHEKGILGFRTIKVLKTL